MRNLFLIMLILFMPMLEGCVSASSIEKRNMRNLREIFKEWENPKFDPDNANKTHAKSYIQHVDGKTLNYYDYVAHNKKVKEMTSQVKIFFDHMIAQGNKVATAHRAEVIKKDGTHSKFKVVALYEFDEQGKLILCDELTHLADGSNADRDLGSRQ